MRNPQPFVVIQNAKPIFTVYARSIEQARERSQPASRTRPTFASSRRACEPQEQPSSGIDKLEI